MCVSKWAEESTKTLRWCGCGFTVGGWRTGFGLQQQWVEDGGLRDPRWVRRPDGGCCPRRCQVNSCCCSNAGLNQPPSLHPSYHPPTCLCLPAWMCASFLFTFSTVSPLAWSFTCPNCPNYLVASHLIFHLGILNSDPELFEIFFLQKGFQHKIKFLKFMFFTLFSKTKWTVELLPWHEIFSCGAGHNVWTGRFDVVLHLMPHFFDVVFLQMPHFHFLRTSFLFLSCSHFLFGAMSVLWSAPRFISSFVA